MTDHQRVKSRILELDAKDTLQDVNWDNLREIIDEVLLPKNTASEIRPFERDDFKSIPDLVKNCSSILHKIFSSPRTANSTNANTCILSCVYSVILLCGEHSSHHMWTDDECIDLCERMLRILLVFLNCKNLSTFLMESDSKRKLHGSNLFMLLSKKLSNEDWKYFPAAVACYSWLLQQIQIPNMKEFVNFTLPVSLNILTDHEVKNKILALDCVHHILVNISTSELHWQIQIEVLHNVLKPLFYYREAELIIPLTKCTLEVVNKSQSTPKDMKREVDLKWSFFDEVLTVFLPMMEYEQDIERRCAYAQSLCLILEFSNFAIAKWTTKLFSIIEDYSKTPITEVEASKALHLYIRTCWPLVKDHWRFINVVAGRILFRSSKNEAITNAETVLRLLKELVPSDTEIIDADCIKSRRKDQ